MTQEEKDILMIKLLSEPEILTSEEIDSIVSDEDLCQIYSTASILKMALYPNKEYDVDEEWKAFSLLIKKQRPRNPVLMRVAAIFIGALLSASIIYTFYNSMISPTDEIMMVEAPTDTVAVPVVEPVAVPAIVQNEQTETSEFKKTKPSKSFNRYLTKEKKHSINKPEEEAVETNVTDEEIRQLVETNRARVDNKIAQRQADIYMQQYYTRQRSLNQSPEMPVVYTGYSEYQPQQGSFMRVVME